MTDSNFRAWTEMEVSSSLEKRVLAKRFVSPVEGWPISSFAVKKLGGNEGVAFLLRMARIDIDGSGNLSEKELEQAESEVDKAIDSVCQLYLNASVVSALVLSIIVPLLLAKLDVAPQTEEYFEQDGVEVLMHCFYGILAIAFGAGILVLYKSTQGYMALTNWMPTREAQMWYIEAHGQMLVAIGFNSLLWMTALAVPFGTTLAVGPIQGLYVFIVVLLVCIVGLVSHALSGVTCSVYQHTLAKKFLQSQAPSAAGESTAAPGLGAEVVM